MSRAVQQRMELRYREALVETHLMVRIPHEPEFVDKLHRVLEQDPHKWGEEAPITATAGVSPAARHLALGIGPDFFTDPDGNHRQGCVKPEKGNRVREVKVEEIVIDEASHHRSQQGSRQAKE